MGHARLNSTLYIIELYQQAKETADHVLLFCRPKYEQENNELQR